MADDRITYTIVVDFSANGESALNYAFLKAQVLDLLPRYVGMSKGTAMADFVSIAAVES